MGVQVQFSTIPEMFQSLTAKFSREAKPVLMYKARGEYHGISYSDLKRQVERLASGLASMGLRRGDRIAIISENRPEWVVCDMAIVSLGAIDVPIYPTMTAKQIEFILNDSRSRFVIVSNQFQLAKVQKIIHEAPSLEKIVLLRDDGGQAVPHAVSFTQVMAYGERFETVEPEYVRNAIQGVHPEDLLTIIYTSGTTGNPKGVMLTHRNMVTNIQSASLVINLGIDDRILSFLPLCHSFERMAGYYTALACGSTIAYAESLETVRDNMLEVQPTVITTVPRLFERIHNRILKQVDADTPLHRKIFDWAIGVGKQYAHERKKGRASLSLRGKRALADALVFRKIRARTGGKMKYFVSGGAALPKEIGEFFEAIGLVIIEGYGLTESSPVITANRLADYRFGSVGQPIPGVEVKIASDGEILARGPNIMKGYWNNPAATKEAVDDESWLHTGDIGMIDAEGFVHITDRKKHLFVSSGGKNIAPQPIENLFLSSKYIEQFMLIGDRRMFLTALIVPDFEALKEYADGCQIPYKDDLDLTRSEEIDKLMEKEISGIQRDLANYERVRKFTLLEKPFSIEEGELTPTQKVRRKVVEERYAQIIDKMYAGID
jgi:long-chain acyl-CoA synthetase